MILDETSQPSPTRIDFTTPFIAYYVFKSKDEMIDWAKRVDKEHGVVVAIKRSLNSTSRKGAPNCTSVCERKDKYHKRKENVFQGIRKTGRKKYLPI